MRRLRQDFFITLGLLLIAFQAAAAPNVVLIVADDLGYGDTGVYGSRTILTPHVDRLAESGVRFTSGYVSHPVCSPSRAGYMTGSYQQRHGWEFNPAGRDLNAGMRTDQVTLAEMFKRVGYRTGMVGKWHLGYTGDFHPLRRGFDEYFGVLAGGTSFIDPGMPGVETLGRASAQREPPRQIYRGDNVVEVDEYLTDVFTREALAFLRQSDQPFFLYLSHTTPHTPLQATAVYLDRYAHIQDKATRIYAAMVASLDDSVGAVLDTLAVNGQLENTLVVFLSDNGCASYINGACSNGPLAGYKRHFHEGGIRVPFIISWPGQLPSGTVYEKPVSALDLMATFAAAAGGDSDSPDSVNLLPFLSGQAGDEPHEYLFWRAGFNAAVRDRRWKLIRYRHSDLTFEDLGSDGRLPPPEGGWDIQSPGEMLRLLYDLEEDPGEKHNVATKHPHIVQRLEEALADWSVNLPREPILPATRSTLAEIDNKMVQLIF